MYVSNKGAPSRFHYVLSCLTILLTISNWGGLILGLVPFPSTPNSHLNICHYTICSKGWVAQKLFIDRKWRKTWKHLLYYTPPAHWSSELVPANAERARNKENNRLNLIMRIGCKDGLRSPVVSVLNELGTALRTAQDSHIYIYIYIHIYVIINITYIYIYIYTYCSKGVLLKGGLLHGFPSGIIRWKLNDTEKISMDPAQKCHAQIEKCKHLLSVTCKRGSASQMHFWRKKWPH